MESVTCLTVCTYACLFFRRCLAPVLATKSWRYTCCNGYILGHFVRPIFPASLSAPPELMERCSNRWMLQKGLKVSTCTAEKSIKEIFLALSADIDKQPKCLHYPPLSPVPPLLTSYLLRLCLLNPITAVGHLFLTNLFYIIILLFPCRLNFFPTADRCWPFSYCCGPRSKDWMTRFWSQFQLYWNCIWRLQKTLRF